MYIWLFWLFVISTSSWLCASGFCFSAMCPWCEFSLLSLENCLILLWFLNTSGRDFLPWLLCSELREQAHRHLASIKSTCKIWYLFKWLMRMQQSVSLDNLEMSVRRQGGCTAWFVLFVTQPNCKMLLCPDTMLIFGSLHLKMFASQWWNATYFFLCSLLLKYCGLHLPAPDKPKSYPLLCWLLVLTSSTVCNHGNCVTPVWTWPMSSGVFGGPRIVPAGFHELWMGSALGLAGVRLPCVSLPCHLLSCVLCLTKAM